MLRRLLARLFGRRVRYVKAEYPSLVKHVPGSPEAMTTVGEITGKTIRLNLRPPTR